MKILVFWNNHFQSNVQNSLNAFEGTIFLQMFFFFCFWKAKLVFYDNNIYSYPIRPVNN